MTTLYSVNKLELCAGAVNSGGGVLQINISAEARQIFINLSLRKAMYYHHDQDLTNQRKAGLDLNQ